MTARAEIPADRITGHAEDAAADPVGFAAGVRDDPGAEGDWWVRTACIILDDAPGGNPASRTCPRNPATRPPEPQNTTEPDPDPKQEPAQPTDPGAHDPAHVVEDAPRLVDAAEDLVDRTREDPPGVTDHIVGFVVTVRDWVFDRVVVPTAQAPGAAFDAVADGLAWTRDTTASAGRVVGDGAAGVASGFMDCIDALASGFTGAKDWLVDGLAGAWTGISDAAGDAAASIGTGIADAGDNVGSATKAAKDAVAGAASDAWNTVRDGLTGIFSKKPATDVGVHRGGVVGKVVDGDGVGDLLGRVKPLPKD